MVKKTTSRRTVNQQGVKKHKISSKPNAKNVFVQIQELIPRKHVATLHKFSECVFKFLMYVCCKLSFIRVTVNCEGRLRAGKTVWELVAHYAVLGLQMSRMLHIFWVASNRAADGLMDLTTFLCISSLLAYVDGFSLASALLFRPYDTVQLVNTSPIILSLFPKNGKDRNMFENPKHAIVIAALAIVAVGAAVLVSAFGFAVDEYPVSLYRIAESITGRPEFLPYALWKLIFWPVELLIYAHLLILCGFSSMILLTFPVIALACSDEIRKPHVNSADSWMKLRRKYYLLQVYLSLVNSWVKFMIVPAILAICSTIVICLYVTLRHSEIAILMYLAFVGLGVSLLVLLFWFSFEVIALIRSTEAIVATLNTRDQPYFLQLSPMEQRFLTKCGRATRQAVFEIGDFVEYTIDCPIGYWDEILNQLIFLLTF